MRLLVFRAAYACVASENQAPLNDFFLHFWVDVNQMFSRK